MEMLRIFVRTLGYGNTEIARRSHIAHANVGRYFRGEARVPLEFILAVVHGLGLEFSEFFELAYPDPPPAPSVARRKIERILEILPLRRMAAQAEAPDWSPPELVAPMPRPEIEKMLDKFREEMNAKLGAHQAGQDSAHPEEPPARPARSAPRAKKGTGKR